MGNKIVQDAEDLYVAGTKSATFRSDPFLAVGWTSVDIQQVITAASGLSGTSVLQVSNDKTNWDDYPGSSHAFTGNESFTWMVVAETPAKWLSLLTTISAGSGTFAATRTGIKTIT